MQYDLSKQLINSDGTPAVEGDKPVTVQTVTVRALLADVNATGGQLTPDDKLKRYQLFKKVSASGPIDFTAEEAALAASAAGVFSPLVYGQVKDFFDGK